MIDPEQKIPGTETVYVRLSSDLLVLLDIECAKQRIRRPAAIALAIESWLKGGSVKIPETVATQLPEKSDSVFPVAAFEENQWATILGILERIEAKLEGITGGVQHGGGSAAPRPTAADLLERVARLDKSAAEDSDAGKRTLDAARGNRPRNQGKGRKIR